MRLQCPPEVHYTSHDPIERVTSEEFLPPCEMGCRNDTGSSEAPRRLDEASVSYMQLSPRIRGLVRPEWLALRQQHIADRHAAITANPVFRNLAAQVIADDLLATLENAA